VYDTVCTGNKDDDLFIWVVWEGIQDERWEHACKRRSRGMIWYMFCLASIHPNICNCLKDMLLVKAKGTLSGGSGKVGDVTCSLLGMPR
jgi:hypothetical protein